MKRKIITLIAAALMALSVVTGAGASNHGAGNNGNHYGQGKNGNNGHHTGQVGQVSLGPFA